MSSEDIRGVARSSGSGIALDSYDGRNGAFWTSRQSIQNALHYEVVNPPGLHIGCGTASIQTRSRGFGEFSFQRYGVTAMLCPEGGPLFQTSVRGKTASACGLFLPLDALVSTENAALQEIAVLLERGCPVRASSSVPLSLILRLCEPIDPWFDGAARDLAFEARTLEVSAFVLSWLEGREAYQPGPRNDWHAYVAREVLESRLTNPPTLAELAKEVGINPRSLTAAFRQCFQTSIAAYVTERRLELALSLLERGMLPGEVARKVGFTASHLSNAFHRRFGISPTDLRRGMKVPGNA